MGVWLMGVASLWLTVLPHTGSHLQKVMSDWNIPILITYSVPSGSVSMYGLVSLKLILGGLWSSISSAPTVLRMCPPLTTKNWLYYAPLVAVGTSNGSVLIFNLSKRVLYKELAVHSCTIQ
ncbi:MAG: hypothetical protein MJE68_03530 [Proteobacteria bacterium]|nr:hypothetical protein [Pseudomonadota bacterium]